MNVNALEVNQLTFSYGTRKNINNVLSDLSFQVREGELLSILGPNGVGKSTLFQCILGILKSYVGSITLFGKNAGTLSYKELAKYIAYIPQTHIPGFHYTVLEMVLMGTASELSSFVSPRKEQIKRAEEALALIGIQHLANQDYMSISGGERQMVLIARALVQNAKLILMDEPTANLDYGNSIRILKEIKNLTKAGFTIIQTTHNPDQAFLFSDKVLAMYAGKALAFGTPKQVINTDNVRILYHTEVETVPLYQDNIRVCIPDFVVRKINSRMYSKAMD